MRRAVGLEPAGPSARRPERLGRLLSSAFALFCACRGEHIVLTSGDAGLTTDDAGSTTAADDPNADDAAEGPVLTRACPTDLEQRRARDDCWPTRYVGRWSGFVVGDPVYEARDGALTTFPVGALELRLSSDGTGQLTFAGASIPPAPPTAAADPYLCTGSTPMTGCAGARQLVEGFAYTLENVSLFEAGILSAPLIGEEPLRVGERFHFGISLGEPWRAWCGSQVSELRPCNCAGCESDVCFELGLAPGVANVDACETDPGGAECAWLAARDEEPCVCRSDGCVARERALAIQLQMSEDGQALRGEYRPSRADLRAGRLEFVRLE